MSENDKIMIVALAMIAVYYIVSIIPNPKTLSPTQQRRKIARLKKGQLN